MASGLKNESPTRPTYIQYTEEDWNKVLTHPNTSHPPPARQSHQQKPSIQSADKVSSTRPNTMSYSSEIFQKAVGFRNIQQTLEKLTTVSNNTLHINDLGRDPVEIIEARPLVPGYQLLILKTTTRHNKPCS